MLSLLITFNRKIPKADKLFTLSKNCEIQFCRLTKGFFFFHGVKSQKEQQGDFSLIFQFKEEFKDL
jgi:hypothetical protein